MSTSKQWGRGVDYIYNDKDGNRSIEYRRIDIRFDYEQWPNTWFPFVGQTIKAIDMDLRTGVNKPYKMMLEEQLIIRPLVGLCFVGHRVFGDGTEDKVIVLFAGSRDKWIGNYRRSRGVATPV